MSFASSAEGHDKAAKMYRFMVWFFKTITYIFFDDIEIVGQDKIPLEGPVIFVGASAHLPFC